MITVTQWKGRGNVTANVGFPLASLSLSLSLGRHRGIELTPSDRILISDVLGLGILL